MEIYSKQTSKESYQVQRAREKLKKQIEEESKQITPEALRQVSKDILAWLSNNSGDRIPLKNKITAVFDDNQHSAKTRSKFIQRRIQELKQPEAEDVKALAGRVSSR